MLYLFSLLSTYSLRWEPWVASDTSSSTSTSPLVLSVTEKYWATSANELAENENYVWILNLNHPKFRLTVMRQWVANIIFIISHPVPKSTQQTLLIFLRLSKQSDFYAKVTKKWKYLQFTILLISISTSEKKHQLWKNTRPKRKKLRIPDYSHWKEPFALFQLGPI